MLTPEQTEKLIILAKAGDNNAKETLLKHNHLLIKSILRRFIGKGVEYEDLYQLACIGFLKAITGFNTDFGVRFSTYAVPMICGEIKRFLRDDGSVKVSRALKTLSRKINAFVEEYRIKNAKDPVVGEIAAALGYEEQEIVFAMDSARRPVSIFEKEGADEDGLELIERIPSGDTDDQTVDKISLHAVIEKLPERERKIIYLRYFRDQTQCEVAAELGVSQVQISRLETKILKKLREGV